MSETTPILGIDIGSSSVKCVVLDGPARIRGIGIVESSGVVRGVVTNVHEVARCIREAVNLATTEAGVEIDECVLALSGESLGEHRATAEIDIPHTEVTEKDVESVTDLARGRLTPEMINRTVIHEIPQSFWVDSTKTLHSPVSLSGSRLGVAMLYISALTRDKDAAEAAIREAGLSLVETITAPVASSLVSLTSLQKNAGSMHVLVGRDTTLATIYEHGVPTALKTFPFGSNDVTEEIALAITVSLDEAERLKRHAHTELMKEKKKVLATIQKKHRMISSELRLFIDSKRRVLPAGIILTGGGGQLPLLETHIREFMRLPTTRASLPKAFGTNKRHLDAALTPAIGAAAYGQMAMRDSSSSFALGRTLKKFFRRIGGFIGTLLP